MARVTLPLILGPNGVQVAAPTYVMVAGSFKPLTAGVIHADGVHNGVPLGHPALAGATVDVDVPDEDCTNGQLDPKKLKDNYPNHWLIHSGTVK